MRFTEIQAFAAHIGVKLGQRAGAPFSGLAAVNNDIGIRAEQFQATFPRQKKFGAVYVGVRLGIKGTAAHDAGRLVQWYLFDLNRIVEDGQWFKEICIAVFFAHEPDLVADDPLEHRRTGAVTRGGDGVITISRNAHARDLFCDRKTGAG